MSVPNQNIITIKKTPLTKGYLAINQNEWIEASKDLTPAGFQLYLYLADNKENYAKELSMVAVTNAFGFSEKTYRRSVKELKEKNYLVETSSNHYNFYTVPQTKMSQDKESTGTKMSEEMDKNVPAEGQKCPSSGTKMSREITNNYITNNNYNEAFADAKSSTAVNADAFPTVQPRDEEVEPKEEEITNYYGNIPVEAIVEDLGNNVYRVKTGKLIRQVTNSMIKEVVITTPDVKRKKTAGTASYRY